MDFERKSFRVAEVKVANADEGIIEAYVSVFNNLDYGDDIVRPGFFKDSIESGKLPKGVWMHDITQPVAKTLQMQEVYAGDPRLPASLKENGGLYVKGQFNLDTQRGREAFSDLKFGTVDEFSFGYQTLESNRLEGGKRELLKGLIFEWSPVTIGMNPATVLVSAKSLDAKEETMETKNKKSEIKKLDYKAMFADVLEAETYSLWNLQWTLCDALCLIDQQDDAAEQLGIEYDYEGEIRAALAEFTEAVVRGMVEADAAEDAAHDAQDDDYDEDADTSAAEDSDTNGYMGKDQATIARKSKLELGRSYSAFLTVAGDAVEQVISRTKARIEMRRKEGRMLSSANETMLGNVADALETHAQDLRALLDSNAKPKGKTPSEIKARLLIKRQAFLELEAEAEELMLLAD